MMFWSIFWTFLNFFWQFLNVFFFVIFGQIFGQTFKQIVGQIFGQLLDRFLDRYRFFFQISQGPPVIRHAFRNSLRHGRFFLAPVRNFHEFWSSRLCSVTKFCCDYTRSHNYILATFWVKEVKTILLCCLLFENLWRLQFSI